jgi:hypothetical protein
MQCSAPTPRNGSGDVAGLKRTVLVLLCSFVPAAATTTAARGAEVQRPRRVLMVQSFARSSAPFIKHATAFELTIKQEFGAAVDLEQVSLENARYA